MLLNSTHCPRNREVTSRVEVGALQRLKLFYHLQILLKPNLSFLFVRYKSVVLALLLQDCCDVEVQTDDEVFRAAHHGESDFLLPFGKQNVPEPLVDRHFGLLRFGLIFVFFVKKILVALQFSAYF